MAETICSACSGSGVYDHDGSPPCGACGGSGSIQLDAEELEAELYTAKARITELEIGLKMAASDLQRGTDEMAKILGEKGAKIVELAAMLKTVTNHLETANEMLLSDGITDAEEDYADEKSVIEEARDLIAKYAPETSEEDGSKTESPV